MPQALYIVDAFTDRPLAGNPAAVVPLEMVRPDEWMQAIGNEMNLAETAFVQPHPNGDWNLRWFTPTVEVDLCGHATLASAFVLWHTGRADPNSVLRFHTRSGVLRCTKFDDRIELDFPACPATACPVPPDITTMLGTTPTFVGANGMDLLTVVADEQTVRSLKPNLSAIATLPVRGVIVTAKASTPGLDFVSRFFAPQSGVPEDPVTGSAHCCLGPYWQAQLGRSELRAAQVSPRSGRLHVRCAGDRVFLGGQAALILEGVLHV